MSKLECMVYGTLALTNLTAYAHVAFGPRVSYPMRYGLKENYFDYLKWVLGDRPASHPPVRDVIGVPTSGLGVLVGTLINNLRKK